MVTRKAKSNRRRLPVSERIARLGTFLRAGARWITPLLVLAAVAVVVPIAMVSGYLHIVSTPYFSLEDVSVRGLHRLDEATVLSAGGVHRGANAFDVDAEVVEARIEAMPWIRNARAERRLPRTLEIVVEERHASAVLVDGESYTLVDARGEPFKQIEDSDPIDDLLELPLITGMSRAEASARPGQRLVLEALEVVRLAEANSLPTLSEVHIDPVMGLSIIPADTGIEIRLGRGRYPQRLEKLRAVLATMQREGERADYILLDSERSLNRVTVGNTAMDRNADRTPN